MKQGMLLVCVCVGAASAVALGKHLRRGLSCKRGPPAAQAMESSDSSNRKAADGQHCIIYVDSKSFDITSATRLKLPEQACIVPLSEMPENVGTLRIIEFMRRLNTSLYGRLLFYGPEMPSTQTFLHQNIHELPVGTVCIADVQYKGKGRAGNAWVSPKGCLMFSFIVQMENGREVPFVQYVVSLAVIKGIEAVCLTKNVSMPDVKIKWPNDLYAGGLKVGGVLCTSTYSEKKFHIVAGLGLNVDNQEPTTCLNSLLRDIDSTATPFEREDLLVAILSSFEELVSLFSTHGFTPLESLYYQRWLHSGQKVTIEERDDTSSTKSSTTVVIEGLTSTGYLLARDDNFNRYELHPDGNSLDFFQGLIRRKLHIE